MTTERISKRLPIGDAATELRRLIPFLDQMMAVSILRSVERGFRFVSDDGYTVTNNAGSWTVTDSEVFMGNGVETFNWLRNYLVSSETALAMQKADNCNQEVMHAAPDAPMVPGRVYVRKCIDGTYSARFIAAAAVDDFTCECCGAEVEEYGGIVHTHDANTPDCEC